MSTTPTTPTTTLARRALRVGALTCALALSGCGALAKHGKYTTEHKNAAQSRIDALKAQTEYQMSLQALTDMELDKAFKHCEKAITLAPTVARTYVLLGRIVMEKSDLQQAAFAFDKAEEVDPTFTETYYYKGLLAERVARKEEAFNYYKKAGDMDNDNPQYAIAAAEMLIDLDRTQEAEQYLLDRQQVFQHSAGIQQTLGHIAMLKGDYTTAERYYTEARLLAPDESEVLEDLSRAQFNLSKWGEAEASLARLLKNEKFAARRDLTHMRAGCLVNLNRNAQARDLLVTLTKDDEGQSDTQAWISLGQVAYTLGDWSRVRQSFVRTLALAPERSEGYVLKGLHQRRTQDFRGAEESFHHAATIDPTAETLTMLALVQRQQGNEEGAQRTFAAALRADPNNAAARQLMNGAVANAPDGQ